MQETRRKPRLDLAGPGLASWAPCSRAAKGATLAGARPIRLPAAASARWWPRLSRLLFLGAAADGAAVEEAEVMLETFEAPVPLIGFYSGVEIAPVNGRSRSLDWTAVLTVLHRRG